MLRRFVPNFEHVVIAVLIVEIIVVMAQGVSDNSLLVHITTGRLIVSDWAIPRADPYSFTALGEPWVVQSWLVSVVYGLADALGGERLITFIHMIVAAVTAFVMVITGRSGTVLRTLGVLLVPTALAALVWPQRPTLFGLCAFALLVMIVHKRQRAWLLVPLMWFWVNMHGSFPIGIVWIASVLVGSWIDTRKIDRSVLRYLGFAVLGVCAGAINPIGPKILLFPLKLIGERSESFDSITEWSSPDFHLEGGLLALVLIMSIVAAGFAGKVQWRYGLAVVGLVAAGLYSARYIAMLPIAAVPLLFTLVAAVPSKPKSDSPLDASKQKTTSRSDAAIALFAMALCGLFVFASVLRVIGLPAVNLDKYPVAAVDWMQSEGLVGPSSRIVSNDNAGCYLIWRYRGDVGVFVDDRVDMYPPKVSADFRRLSRLDGPYDSVLADYRATAVLWPAKKPLGHALAENSEWQLQWQDKDWMVLTRR